MLPWTNYLILVWWTCFITSGATLKELSEKKLPQLIAGYPNNTSVLIGNEAVLKCVVHNEQWSMPPHVKWLKRVPKDHKKRFQTGRHQHHRLLPVENQHVLVIQESHEEAIHIKETQLNGTFVSKLIFSRTSSEDEGVYICLATNNVGYIHKEARLTVFAGPAILANSSLVIPFPVIVIGMSIGIALLATGAGCSLQKYQNKSEVTKSLQSTQRSSRSVNSSAYRNHDYDQKHLLVSETTFSPGTMICQTNKIPLEETIEMTLSPCSCSVHASRISTIQTYEQCYNNTSILCSTTHAFHC